MKHTAKKILAVLLTAALLVGTLASFAGAWYEPNYKKYVYLRDVPKSASDQAGWSYDGIYWCVANGIMSGLGNVRAFEPDRDMTRAMYTQLCYNLVKNLERDMSVETQTLPFTDLNDDAWYMEAMTWAYENGVIGGMGGGIMAPDASITREQIAQLLYNLLTQYFKVDLSEASVDLTETYRDAEQIGKWAQTAVSTMTAIGLYQGDNGNFRPNGKATRAQIAVLAERLYRYYSRTWECYLDPGLQLVPTMLEDFDGEGKQGWNDNFWTPCSYSSASFLPAEEERMYTQDGNLYMNAYWPGDNNTNDNGICGLFSGHDVPNKFSQSFGYYEIRFKPCPARAICSAWWLTTNAHGYPQWPTDGSGNPAQDVDVSELDPYENFIEMDIFETSRNNVQVPIKGDKLTTTLHWNHWQGNSSEKQMHQYVAHNKMCLEREQDNPYFIPDSSMFDGKYHTVGFLWTKDGYQVWYDGNYAGDFSRAPLSDMSAVLRLNLYYWNTDAERPYNGDCYREDFDENGISQFVIDYVHVYQLAEYTEEYAPNYYGNEVPAYYTEAIGALASE